MMANRVGCDFEAIRTAFPLASLDLCEGVAVRPLHADDLPALTAFMSNDPEMTWTRRPWNEDNVAYLLGLRLKHYETWGFGPYGVVIEGNLAGMAGIQVWDESDCTVEALVYLARRYWSRGLGRRMLQAILNRAFDDAKVSQVFAATRPENLAAAAIAEAVGFIRVGEGVHFGCPSIEWRATRPAPAS